MQKPIEGGPLRATFLVRYGGGGTTEVGRVQLLEVLQFGVVYFPLETVKSIVIVEFTP